MQRLSGLQFTKSGAYLPCSLVTTGAPFRTTLDEVLADDIFEAQRARALSDDFDREFRFERRCVLLCLVLLCLGLRAWLQSTFSRFWHDKFL
jgi:hypothetical protein